MLELHPVIIPSDAYAPYIPHSNREKLFIR